MCALKFPQRSYPHLAGYLKRLFGMHIYLRSENSGSKVEHQFPKNFRSYLFSNWDRIKGLKLRHIDAYCGGATVHKGEKESLVYSGSCTAAIAAIYIAAADEMLRRRSLPW